MSFESKPPRVGLWSNDRGPMASGNCGAVRFVLWRNERKKNDREPDFHLVMEQAQKREERQPDLDRPSQESRGGFDNGDEVPF